MILESFHRLLRKEADFVWTQECQNSFQKIKDYLTSSPILPIFDGKLPIHIYTDANLEGIGAVLKQPQNEGIEKPVA